MNNIYDRMTAMIKSPAKTSLKADYKEVRNYYEVILKWLKVKEIRISLAIS